MHHRVRWHMAGVLTRSCEAAIRNGGEMPASRVTVNTPTTHGAIGCSTNLPPSMTLGCGSWGGNVTSDNVSPLHLMDVKRIAFETRPVTRPLRVNAAAQVSHVTGDLAMRIAAEVIEQTRGRAASLQSAA